MVAYVCHSSLGVLPSRSVLGKKHGTPTPNNSSTKGWECGSSGRVSAEKGQSPEFTPLRIKKKEKEGNHSG
jgi:hypothetical protein